MEISLSIESNHVLVNSIWCSHIWAFHTLLKELYWTVSDCFVAGSWFVCVAYLWIVSRQFLCGPVVAYFYSLCMDYLLC